jgi:hypothetical protein
MLFQEPQASQRPDHLDVRAPQIVQEKRASLAMPGM